MKKYSWLYVVVFLSVFFAQTVYAASVVAQDCLGLKDSQGLFGVFLCRISFFVNATIPILISLATVYFIWGIINYVLGKSDEAKKEGKNRIIWGLIGLSVITGVWGLVALMQSFLLGDNPDQANKVPSYCVDSYGVDCDQ